jgi:hypothetical protein
MPTLKKRGSSLYIIALMNMAENYKESIVMGQWSVDKINETLSESHKIKDAHERIKRLSGLFLNTPYKEHTLTGSIDTSEVFTINLEAVDCFTFLDYVEAMRLSDDFVGFKDSLKKVRYRAGIVDYARRNHFFTDWIDNNSRFVNDAASEIGGLKSIAVKKTLNRKEDGSLWLAGIGAPERIVRYIPSDNIDDEVISRLQTVDYIGIYSNKPGLDVSHVGILIKKSDKIYLRHASSKEGRVFDEDMIRYISDKPGIVVLKAL